MAQASRVIALNAENARLRDATAALHQINTGLQRQLDELANQQTRLQGEVSRLLAGAQVKSKMKPSPPAKRGGRRPAPTAPKPQSAAPATPVPHEAVADEVLPTR